MISVEKAVKIFRVDNPGPYALIDSGLPMWVDEEPDWENHLNGSKSLCVTPIGYDNTCYWGAIDIDAKGDNPAVNHPAVQVFIDEHKLPLNLFYSKSGKGAHAYLFSPKPVPAIEMRAVLTLYSLLLRPLLDDKNDMEIFPKQDELMEGDNGSCIRPPYFGERCAPLFEGEPQVRNIISIPPCLVHLPEEGERNNFIYHIANFLALSEVTSIKSLVHSINRSLDDPLPVEEADKTIASAQRQRNRKGSGFGLGCSSCPDSKKLTCKFSSQLKVRQTSDVMTVEIVHFLAEDPKIRLTVEGKSLNFDTESAFNNHEVRLSFLTKHRTPAIPMMKKGEWTMMMHSLLEGAEHIEEVTHRDKGHFIVQKLKAWSKNFKPGVSALFSGTPCFISDTEAVVFPHDMYNWFMQTGVMGITREDINTTLESVGAPVVMQGSPAIKIPLSLLDVKTPGIEIPLIFDIAPEDVVIECGEGGKAIFKTKEGIRIELTNSYIKEHSEIQERIMEATSTNIKVGF